MVLTVLMAIAVPFYAASSAVAGMLPLSASTLAAVNNPTLYTAYNWAGYAVESNFSSPVSDSVSAVSGSWIVPKARPAVGAGSQFSACATWVGIDGFSDDTVEQVGTESYILDGTAEYVAWYEMYPGGMTTESGFKISPGDSVTASVVYDPPGYANEFQLTLLDITKGTSFTLYQSLASAARTSAEWITEAPSYSSIVPLPDFGSVTFTNAQATVGSETGPIDDLDWQIAEINMVNAAQEDIMDTQGISDSDPSGIDTSSFTIVQVPEPSMIAELAAAAVFGWGICWSRIRLEFRH